MRQSCNFCVVLFCRSHLASFFHLQQLEISFVINRNTDKVLFLSYLLFARFFFRFSFPMLSHITKNKDERESEKEGDFD